MHNNVVTPLTLLVEVERDRKGQATFDLSALRSAVALIDLGEKPAFRELSATTHRQASMSLELYLRRMLSRCAVQIHVPYRTGEGVANPRQIKPLLAPTVKKALRFVDRSDRYWNAVVAYMQPISRSLCRDERVSQLAWDLYQLVLATKHQAEVVLPPRKSLDLIATLSTSIVLTPEARARLSVIEGVFGSFTRPIETQTLRLLPSAPTFAISERIQEIMEDAYLLEASHLRRLLGVRENITSIQRDLRKLLSFIQRRRSWAKGIVGLGLDLGLGARIPLAFLEKITEMAPGLGNVDTYPILAERDNCCANANESTISFTRTISDGTLVHLDGESNRLRIVTQTT